ncbi:MAG: hypothetical protein D6760_11630 [Deltaproteobacteria bacterium]|nr:MAG: hypothetical protein D6760_11630 [Deltaproteobacteria bacterium]
MSIDGAGNAFRRGFSSVPRRGFFSAQGGPGNVIVAIFPKKECSMSQRHVRGRETNACAQLERREQESVTR